MRIQLKNMKEKVEYCLREYEETRENDAQLTLSIIKTFLPGEVKFIDGTYFFSMDSLKAVREDHVKRVRAKFNQDGFYLATNPEVIKKREKARRVWEDVMR